MRYKLTFVVGFAGGYVLGTRAGTERYRQLENAWRRFVDTPAVQQAAGVVGAQASQVIGQAKQTVGAKLSQTMGGRGAQGSAGDGTGWPDAGTAPTAADDAGSPYPAHDYGGHA